MACCKEDDVTQIEGFKEKVVGLRLVNGEGIVVTTTPTVNGTAITSYKNLAQLIVTPDGTGLLSMMDIINSIEVYSEKIVYTFEISDACRENYDELVRVSTSKVIVPKKQLVV